MDYSFEVRQRFAAPARAGTISPAVGGVVEGAAEDRSLRFWVRFQVQLVGTTIECVRFQAVGCPHAIAAADLIADDLIGQPVAALIQLNLEDIARRLELPRSKFGKLLRIEDALSVCHRAAIAKD